MAEELKAPKADPLEGRVGVHSSTRDYINLIEKQNLNRVAKLNKQRRGCRQTAFACTALAVGIYTYTIFAIKQEKFLDDFEQPKFVEKKT